MCPARTGSDCTQCTCTHTHTSPCSSLEHRPASIAAPHPRPCLLARLPHPSCFACPRRSSTTHMLFAAPHVEQTGNQHVEMASKTHCTPARAAGLARHRKTKTAASLQSHACTLASQVRWHCHQTRAGHGRGLFMPCSWDGIFPVRSAARRNAWAAQDDRHRTQWTSAAAPASVVATGSCCVPASTAATSAQVFVTHREAATRGDQLLSFSNTGN